MFTSSHEMGQNAQTLAHKKRGPIRKLIPFGFGFGFVSDPVKDTNGKPCQKVGESDNDSVRHYLFRACHFMHLLVCEVSTVCHPSGGLELTRGFIPKIS